jgi:hypothetical protein
MKSFTMKALAVAVLGMGGMSVASAVTCPSDPAQSGGGAWSTKSVAADASLAITSPGLNGTNCALTLAIGALSNSRSFVSDSSPQNEQRYRARFYLNTAGLTNFTVSNQTINLMRVNDTTGPAQFTSDELVVKFAGGATPTIRFFASDSNSVSGATQLAVPLPDALGNYRVEVDIQIGTGTTNATHGCDAMPATGGCLRVWVSKASDATVEATPSASARVNNSGWSGAKTLFLGMSVGSPQYRSAHAGATLVFDEFDSRRQTFIGQ